MASTIANDLIFLATKLQRVANHRGVEDEAIITKEVCVFGDLALFTQISFTIQIGKEANGTRHLHGHAATGIGGQVDRIAT